MTKIQRYGIFDNDDGYVVEDHEGGIWVRWDDVEHLIRRVSTLEKMLVHERTQAMNTIHLLTKIHSLLYPAPITAEDGRVWAFRPVSTDPHEILQELSDRIRELPEKIAAMTKDGA